MHLCDIIHSEQLKTEHMTKVPNTDFLLYAGHSELPVYGQMRMISCHVLFVRCTPTELMNVLLLRANKSFEQSPEFCLSLVTGLNVEETEQDFAEGFSRNNPHLFTEKMTGCFLSFAGRYSFMIVVNDGEKRTYLQDFSGLKQNAIGVLHVLVPVVPPGS